MLSRRFVAIVVFCGVCAGCSGKAELAEIQMQRGKWESAARLYREVVAEDPSNLPALRSLAAVECFRLSELDSCKTHVDSLLAQMPRDSETVATAVFAYTKLAAEAAQKKDSTAAREYLTRLGHIYFDAGYWNYMNEDYRVAERQLRGAARLLPKDWRAYNRLGILFWNRHMTDSSVAWFHRGLKVAPESEDMLSNLGVVQWEAGRFDSAQATVARLTALRHRLYPDSVFVPPVDTTKKPQVIFPNDQYKPLMSF